MDTKDQVDKSLVKFSGEWTDRAKADKREHLGVGLGTWEYDNDVYEDEEEDSYHDNGDGDDDCHDNDDSPPQRT